MASSTRAQGELLLRSEIVRTDEVGKLSEAFNKMAEKLYKLICDLKVTNIELQAAKIEAGSEPILNFDLIIMNIQMPEMNGIEVAKIIRQKEKVTGGHIPIVATTGYAMTKDKEDALSSGMDDYLSKPIDIVKLEEVIEKYIK